MVETKNVLTGQRVAVGSIGDDIHVVGITILAHALRDAGAEVIQLGIQTSPQEFVHAAVDEDVDAVFVSSSNGHARIFCDDLPKSFAEAGIGDVLLYVGGNLAVTASAQWVDVERDFLELGFDRAFPPRTAPAVAVEALANDLEETE